MSDVIKKNRPDQGQRFPFIPLPRAIERARELYKIAQGHEVPVVTAVRAWGYSGKSSGGLQTVAALKAFGLLEDSGNAETRKVKLSEAGLRILRDPRDISPERDALVRRAALTPPIHSEIIEKYNGLPPSDEAFKAHLLMERNFKDAAVDDFLKEFAATMAYAKVSDSGTIQDMNQTVSPQNIPASSPNKPTETAGVVVRRYPGEGNSPPEERTIASGLLSGSASFRVLVTGGPLGVKEIERLIKKLQVDKEILAEADAEGADSAE